MNISKYIWGLILLLPVCLVSCSGDEPKSNDLVGTWYGTRHYNNPVGGTRYQYLTVNLNSDKTGSLEYEGPTVYTNAQFTYSVKNSTIKCKGVSANTDGDVNTDFSLTLKIEGDRLYPTDRYTQFILTKDNSVMTDGNGDEIIDNSNELQQVWVHTTGETVIQFLSSSYIEYVLTKPYASTYSMRYEGSYEYDILNKLLYLGDNVYEILTLTDSYLSFKSKKSGTIFSYNAGTQSDIPANNTAADKDYANTQLLISPFCWTASDVGYYSNHRKSHERSITLQFYGANNITMVYSYRSYYSSGSVDSSSVIGARGTFTLKGSKLYCSFSQVEVSDGSSTEYLGWVNGQPKDQTYDITIHDNDNISINMFGSNYDFEATF